jgi:peptide/nickel transport system substrate-binding protein
MRKLIKTSVILISLLFFAACSRQHSEDHLSPARGGTAKISLQCANDILFPFVIQESNLRKISEFILNPALISYDGNGDPVEMLASAWQVDAANTSVTYILNSAYRWNDGTRISTRDVLFTFKVLQTPYFKVRMPGQFKVIREIEVIDSLAFRIQFSRPVADPFYNSKLPLLPSKWEEHLTEPDRLIDIFREKFVGCGPFILSQSSPDSLILTRNPFYPDEFPLLDTLTVYFFAGEDVLAGRIQHSAADLFVDLPFTLLNLIKRTPGYDILTYPERGYSFLAWNLRKKIFTDRQIRRALSMAIDRDALINGVLAGYARKTEGPIYPGLADFNDTLPPVTYNPQEAERILDEAGWKFDETSGVRMRNGQRFEFSLLFNRENPIRKEIALNIKANLAAIGVAVKTEMTDWQNIRQSIRDKNFDAMLLTWVDEDIYDPSQIFHSAGIGHGLNMMSYLSHSADSLIEEGLNTTDPELRYRSWREFQTTVAGDLPCTFLFNQEIICGIRSRLKDVRVNENGYLINVKEWWVSHR